MSFVVSPIFQLREQDSVVKPISESTTKANVGKGNELGSEQIKEISANVDHVENVKDNESNNQQLRPEDVEKALSNLTDYSQNIQRQINFSVDEDSNRTVIKVIDSESEEVIREIPSKEILAIARAIDLYFDDSKGKILHAQA